MRRQSPVTYINWLPDFCCIYHAIYFFLNAMYSYQNATTEEEKEQEKYLVAATFFILLGALLYLPLGNSNLIIEN